MITQTEKNLSHEITDKPEKIFLNRELFLSGIHYLAFEKIQNNHWQLWVSKVENTNA